MFDRAGAQTLVKNLPGGPCDSTEAMRSRITDVGNILISWFVDGWANVLCTSITHSPPECVHDAAPEIVGPITDDLATSQEYAFVFDSLVETTDNAITGTR